MSRIGRKPVAIPAGTDVSIADGNVVTVKGKLGTLTQALSSKMIIKGTISKVEISRIGRYTSLIYSFMLYFISLC